ncbi:response regulator [Desulfurivibrio dismutans]|uniref:response regulator n=1 Tax=Desulfurivibrio dismutans TaxID=1398908 RepID=UPI0023DB7B60|nr:response regulator [Desulfurivibrio alkaliphilus]MDF1614745.1 response regulator [Desulfurivibrio alkaliphilus]
MAKAKILLVDDEDLIRASLAMDLVEAGYAAKAASGGEEALDMFRRGDFELVITDLLMEGMDGIELLRALRSEAPEVGVIILTGYGALPTAIEAIRLGADDYLLKPYQFEELQIRLDICLEKRALKKRIKAYEGILPVCSVCRKIRDDEGREPGSGPWLSMEQFLAQKAGLRSSHTYCPHCFEQVTKDMK